MDFIYLDLKQHISTQKNKVTLKEIAQVYCDDKALEHQLNSKVMLINKQTEQKNLQLLDIMSVIEKVRQGQTKKCMVISVGESECLVEFDRRQSKGRQRWFSFLNVLGTIFVGCLCFFGAGVTIMGYHNDIDLPRIFARCYEFFSGTMVQGPTFLEVFYSLGLTGGILIFFHPFQKKKSRTDSPTPLEIQMHNYENDVYSAIDWNKEHEEQK